MHTFFVNTSTRQPVFHPELLDIQLETTRLVPLSCPLQQWTGAEHGYRACAREMGRLVDTYSELTNEFKLVVYVDLLEFPVYRSINDRMAAQPRRFPCAYALRKLISCYISATLGHELLEHGRPPVDMVVVFEQDVKCTEYIKGAHDELCAGYLWEFLGLPSYETLRESYRDFAADFISKYRDLDPLTERPAKLCEQLYLHLCSLIGKPLLATPEDCPNYLLENFTRIIAGNMSAESTELQAQPMLYQWLLDSFPEPGEPLSRENLLPDEIGCCVPQAAVLVTDTFAERSTLHYRTKRVVDLSVLLLQCIRGDRIDLPLDTYKNIPPLNVEAFALLLRRKSAMYDREYDAIRKQRDYADLHMTPVLYPLEYEKFGLDRYGEPETEYSVRKVVFDEDTDVDKALSPEQYETVEERSGVRPLINEADFDYTPFVVKHRKEYKAPAHDPVCRIDERTSLEIARKQTAPYFKAHQDFFKALERHLLRTLPHYAIYPAAILPRREDAVPWSVDESRANQPYFSTHSSAVRSESQREKSPIAADKEPLVLDEAKKLAENAYSNTQKDFFSAGAALMVAKTDIKHHCDTLINKVDQIKKSLSRIFLAFYILLAVILGLYAPYLVTQYREILDDKLFPLSAVIAGLSMAIPLVLLTLIFFILRNKQRRKFKDAWDAFVHNANAAMRENEQAVRLYEQYLTFYIPALRWTYEYREHVQYYADHSRVARGKMEHHEEKLRRYVESIGNVLEDLEKEYDLPYLTVQQQADVAALPRALDHAHAFCSTPKNIAFYSIIESGDLSSLYPSDDAAH